jgi:predicted ATPase
VPRRAVRSEPPYLLGVYTVKERLPAAAAFPFNLPFVATLDIDLSPPVTFLVGENGSGKSTFLEGVADLCGYPSTGGGKNEVADARAPGAELAAALRPKFRQRPRDGFFFRAETTFGFSDLLDRRKDDPDFLGNPYTLYGGRSLHQRSHGEAYLAILENRVRQGLFLFDEPESALSPRRQLAFLRWLSRRVADGQCQFIIATHSPILLTLPGAVIRSFDDPALPVLALDQTEHWSVVAGVVAEGPRFWQEPAGAKPGAPEATGDAGEEDSGLS